MQCFCREYFLFACWSVCFWTLYFEFFFVFLHSLCSFKVFSSLVLFNFPWSHLPWPPLHTCVCACRLCLVFSLSVCLSCHLAVSLHFFRWVWSFSLLFFLFLFTSPSCPCVILLCFFSPYHAAHMLKRCLIALLFESSVFESSPHPLHNTCCPNLLLVLYIELKH